jgi:dimethylargininase
LVRAPEPGFSDALGQQPDADAIDLTRAAAQHRLYVQALRGAGVHVTELPPAPGYPDACFVQDVALLLPQLAIVGRPAEPARQGEVDLIKSHLPASLPVAAITAPGTLEWGDVLRIGDTLYVGQSARTNAAATAQLRELAAPLGLAVEALLVPQGLHLLSGVNYLGPAPSAGPGVLVAWPGYANLPQFANLDVIVTPPAEAPAANCLALGATVIVPAGYPQTAAALWQRGWRVLSTPIGEFAKANGGVTCLSIIGEMLATERP